MLFRLAVLLCVASQLIAASADYPVKPIKVIVPFAPGGGSDTFVRIIQTGVKANGLMKQPFMVINVPGAGGTIGSRRVKNSIPDGYTFLNLHDGIMSAKHSGQALYGPEAFRPVAATGRAGTMICVSGGSPFKTLREVMEAAKKEPKKVSFGANFGATSHFAGLRLAHMYPGAEFTFIPAGGGAKRFAAMKGNHLDVSTFTVAEYVDFREGGLRAVAVLAEERHPAFPEVMTAREQGIDVIWDSVQYWWAPKRTPDEAVEYFAKVLESAMKTTNVLSRLEKRYYEPLYASGDELEKLIAEREARVADLSIRQSIELPNFSRAVTIVLLCLGLGMLWQELKAKEKIPSLTIGEWRSAAIGLGCLMAYAGAFASGVVPYWLVTVVFAVGLGGMLMSRGRKCWGALVVTSWIVAVGCQLVFTKWLVVDLP